MTSYNSILDHPKIPISKDEYHRIQDNLKYFESNFGKVSYTNSDNVSKERAFNHLPLARTASKKLASLVFNEQAEISLADSEANTFLQDTLLNDRFNKNFERYLESCLALGGMAMRPYVDKDRIKVSFVQAPVFLPLQTNTQDVSSAAIVTKSTKTLGKIVNYYTLIEFHEWQEDSYQISNELYRSERPEILGTRVPLTEIYENLEESVEVKGLSRPLFTYLKTPGMNNKDINSPLGLSVYDNAKTTIDFINRTFDEFCWEVRMGQRRVAVPEQLAKFKFGEANGKAVVNQHFDPEQNVFVQISSGDQDKTVGIVDLTTDIRSESYIQAINKGLSLFEMQIGVAPGMFSFDGKSMKTATEVVSENSDTYQLRNSIVSLVEQSIKELVVSIFELATASGIYTGPLPKLQDVNVNLDDGVFTDRQSELAYWSQMVAAGFVGRKFGLMKLLGVDEKTADSILSEVNQDSMGQSNDLRSQEDKSVYGD